MKGKVCLWPWLKPVFLSETSQQVSQHKAGVQKSSCLPLPNCLLLPQPPDGPESPGTSLASENLVTNSLDLQQSRSLYRPPHQLLLDFCDSLSNVFLLITELSFWLRILIVPLPFFTHTNDILGYSHSSTLHLFIHSLNEWITFLEHQQWAAVFTRPWSSLWTAKPVCCFVVGRQQHVPWS